MTACQHRWENRAGHPLHCGDCGELWPGDPDFPPEPFMCMNEGYGAVKDGHVPWQTRVDRVVDELRRVA
jgi:hypothetical protein